MQKNRPEHTLTALLAAVITCLGLLVSAPAMAQSVESDEAAFRRIIASQIEAFRRDDAAAAYTYAAPSIKGIFGTPARFLEMVRKGYGAVYRPRKFTFGRVTMEAGRPTQHVNIVGPDGTSWVALYTMQRQSKGSWKISGVTLLRPKGEPV